MLSYAGELKRLKIVAGFQSKTGFAHMSVVFAALGFLLVFQIWLKPWSVSIQEIKIGSQLSCHVYNLVHDDEARKYWSSKQDMAADSLAVVDWDAIGASMKESTQGCRVFMSKHVTGEHLNSGTMICAPVAAYSRMLHMYEYAEIKGLMMSGIEVLTLSDNG